MRRLRWLAAAMVWGCSTTGAPAVDPGDGTPPELGSSLNVRVAGDSVRLEIHVTNVTSSPIPLEFMTTQRYDFEVSELEGGRIWRWSDGRAFGEALGREVLQPGESKRYMAAWGGGGREGEFVATARIVSGNYPVELRTVFRLPAE